MPFLSFWLKDLSALHYLRDIQRSNTVTRKIGPYEHYIHIETTAANYELLKAAGIEGAHHWHTDRSALDALARRVEEIDPNAMIMYCSGTDMRVRGTRVSVLQLPSCMQYEIRQDLSYGYKVLYADEELADCDCLLSSAINETYPKVKGMSCGKTIKVVSTRIVESADIGAAEQLEYWVNGRSIHATESAEKAISLTSLREGECCPDFSCCTGQIAPEETRKAYLKAHREKDHDLKMQLLSGFLGTALNTTLPEEAKVTGKKPYNAYIATGAMAPTGKSN